MNNFDHILWFASPVWSGEFYIDNEAIKQFAYKFQESNETVHKSNYVGWQSENLTCDLDPSLEVLMNLVDQQVDACCHEAGFPQLKLSNFWININCPFAYNHMHNHPGALLSGVYYVDANPEQGSFYFERNDDGQYFLPPVKEMNNVNSNCAIYPPETGKCFIFPSWLRHSVQPNLTDTDRIAISFNYGVPHENRV